MGQSESTNTDTTEKHSLKSSNESDSKSSTQIKPSSSTSLKSKPYENKDQAIHNSIQSRYTQELKPEDILSIHEYHELAKRKLPKMVYDYYRSGSDDMVTLHDNISAYKKFKLRPRFLLKDVSQIQTKTSLLQGKGGEIDFPIMIAPTAMHRMANFEMGEKATCMAAEKMGTIFTLSSLATTSLEQICHHVMESKGMKLEGDVASLENQQKLKHHFKHWYQLYILKDRKFTEDLVRRVELYGYKALVLTVDAPKLGNRESDHHNKFSLPPGLALSNLGHDPLKEVSNEKTDQKTSALNYYFANQIDASLTWNDVAWLRSITKLPILIKGILSGEDAHLAVQYGCDGIIVSNHGGRQVDSCVATIDALPEVVQAVRSNNSLIDIYLDGGIMRGTDVLKGLALGAKAVFVGRAALWGLSVLGQTGVENVLRILRKEFELALILCGCASLEDVTPKLIFNLPQEQKMFYLEQTNQLPVSKL